MSRGVVQIVGTFRGVAAAVAAGVLLSGCGAGQEVDETTTSPIVTETSANPWDLPIEQRPALFDPCEEIPIEAVEEGVGSSVTGVVDFGNNAPGELISCGWENHEIQFSVLSTWKSAEDYAADQTFQVENGDTHVSGRRGMRLVDRDDSFGSSCMQLFFTERGAVWMRLDLTTGLSEFQGEKLVEACRVIGEVVSPIVAYVPEGDFR